ncbi:MAG: AMP-binding protein [Victivallales bacterium]|jgi:acyl-[acyl-carrier-protein]-phospholipid O-acyltransferase/long-chain-fatty-acid--[acyl-carrier-protein] ligase|nr:AMP-binding protein [Victivallales bacterium]
MNNMTIILLSVLGFIVFLCLLILVLRPRLSMKLTVWILRHTLMRFRVDGVENIPDSGPVLLVSNHVSLIDMLLIQSASHRPVKFMIRKEIIDFVPTRFLFWYLGVIQVPSISQPKAMRRFFHRVRARLRKGEVLCLFPEGGISGNGGLMRFRSGVAPLLPNGVEVTVIPMRIGMLWGRLFTIHKKRLKYRVPRTIPINFSLKIGHPVSPSLSAFEFRQVISELGAESEAAPQPGELPLHIWFAKRAKRHPFTVTYLDADGTKYGNLSMLIRSAILSRRVRKLETNSRYVGVLLPNCTTMVAMIMGVLFADKTPGIINFSAGEEVALEAATRAGIDRILTSRKFLEKLGWQETAQMVILEDEAKKITKYDKYLITLLCLFMPFKMLMRRLAPRSAFNVGREAVLLFSSGSTGKPKAVQLTHRNINCDLWSFWRMILWTKRDRIAGNLPLFHAYGFTVEFAFPALSGTPVIYVPNPLDATGVVKAINEYGVTLLTATPTFLQGYMRKANAEQLKSLRLVITGAEKLSFELAAKFRAMTGLEIVEGYGCTELSPIVTVNLCNEIHLLGKHAHHSGSIGIPLPGIHVRTVDPYTGVELGANQPGLLQVKGGIVMKGYLNDPEQTARVVQNGYYNTGDIARIDRDGYVYITGRASRFSKIGGEMVPHEVVEQAIATIRGNGEREIAVAGRTDAKRGERLVVFYTPDDFDPVAIIAQLRADKLPNLWIPKAEDFVKIDRLPLLGSGKLDLTKLKKLAEKQL